MGVTEMGGPMGMGWYKAWLLVIMETDKAKERRVVKKFICLCHHKYGCTRLSILRPYKRDIKLVCIDDNNYCN